MDKQKLIVFYLIVVAVILVGLYFAPSLSPTTITPLPVQESSGCQSDHDCPSGQSCVQVGPIVLDSVTKQSITHKTCQEKGTAVPY